MRKPYDHLNRCWKRVGQIPTPYVIFKTKVLSRNGWLLPYHDQNIYFKSHTERWDIGGILIKVSHKTSRVRRFKSLDLILVQIPDTTHMQKKKKMSSFVLEKVNQVQFHKPELWFKNPLKKTDEIRYFKRYKNVF